MSKTTKILSIISVILVGVGVLLAASILTFLWEPMNILLNNPDEIVNSSPIIPLGNFVSMFGCATISLVLLTTHKSQKSIVIEILSIILLGIILPLFTYYLDKAQAIWVGNHMGDNALATLGMEGQLLFLPLRFIGLSSTICLLTSGMRIIEKLGVNKGKPIKILSIIAVIVSVSSFLMSIAVLTVLWQPMAFSNVSSMDIIKDGPILPIGTVVSIMGSLIISIYLFVSFKSRRFMVVEIILVIFMGVILPTLAPLANLLQQIYINSIGTNSIIRLIISKNVLDLPTITMGWTTILCWVICGMRISYKTSYKKIHQQEIE